MANISIGNLHPAGFNLLSDTESFMDSVRDLSADELKISGGYGGGYGSGSGSGKSKSKSKSKKSGGSGKSGSGCCYYCH